MLGATLAFAMARIRLARGASQDESTIPPGATVETGAISAEEYGGKGKEIILIPGLGRGAWSWTNMLRRFSPDHRIYALTLAGFDGRAPVAAPMIDKVVADIARFIEARQVDRPILIGHSLGAFIALRLGVEHAKLIGGLVTLDGYPVFPPLAEMNLEDRRAAASRLSQQFKVGRDVKKFREVMREFLAARMNDPTLAANIAERAAGAIRMRRRDMSWRCCPRIFVRRSIDLKRRSWRWWRSTPTKTGCPSRKSFDSTPVFSRKRRASP